MTAAANKLTGQTVDRYEVGERLGQGGFGAVYRARHTVVGNEVALKVLWAEHATEPREVERFLREARAAAGIGHPSIVRVLDAGQTPDGLAFLAMELLEGRSLEDRLRTSHLLGVEEAVRIMGHILDALGAAHAAGIVHRDLKPGNVFLGRDGAVKLLDFGISKIGGESKLTQTGLVLGTPQYMAPEQLDGREAVDGRADLYAAATMLYELLCGELPFPGQGYEAIVQRLQGGRPPPLASRAPHVPPALVGVIERGLALDRDARYPDAAELKRAMESAARGGPVSLGELAIPTEPPRPSPLHGVPAQPALPTPSAPPASVDAAAPTVQRGDPDPSPASIAPPGAATPPWAWAGIGLLALLLAGGLGVLAVLMFRLGARSSETEPGEAAQPTPVSPEPVADEPVSPIPVEAPEIAPEPTPEPTPPEAVSPTGVGPDGEVTFDILSYTGMGPRTAFQAVLDGARDDIAACGRPGEPTHVSIRVIATLQGVISVSQPDSAHPSEDDVVARCVAGAIQSHGPARFTGIETAIVVIGVDVPPR